MNINETPKSILDAFEKIVDAAEKSKLSDEFFQKNSFLLQYVSERLNLSPVQAVFMALLVDKCEEKNISLSRLAIYLGCRATHILQMTGELEQLEKLFYIRIIRGKTYTNYRVPKEVINALSKNQPYIHQKNKIADLASFFDEFRKLIGEKKDDEITYNNVKERSLEMLEEIPTSSLSSGLKKFKLDEDSKILFIFMAHLFFEDNNEDIRFYEIEDLFDEDEIPSDCRRKLRDGNSLLQICKLIENTVEDGLARSDAFKLTEKAKFELLSDLNLAQAGSSSKGLIQFDSLASKKLFYNETERKQVKELNDILGQRRFSKVQAKLKKAGMRSGFCCLFYGPPGTGKTETVYQLARATKRDIMQVDVEKIKSCWVGESEKNLKSLFDRYRNICKKSDRLPILLFNEADALLGRRMEGVSKAVDKMENSLQNIILQEMEKLEGIMIATTNLTINLDKAFDRRFLYKIKLDRPDKETRIKIWSSMIPALKKREARELAYGFDLSGGEIENVARRHIVNGILSATEEIDYDNLVEMCRNESVDTVRHPKVGF